MTGRQREALKRRVLSMSVAQDHLAARLAVIAPDAATALSEAASALRALLYAHLGYEGPVRSAEEDWARSKLRESEEGR